MAKVKPAVILSAAYATPNEADLVKKAARLLGLTPSAFIRRLTVKTATRVLRQCRDRR